MKSGEEAKDEDWGIQVCTHDFGGGWALVRALKGEEDDEADMPMQDLPTEGMR